LAQTTAGAAILLRWSVIIRFLPASTSSPFTDNAHREGMQLLARNPYAAGIGGGPASRCCAGGTQRRRE